MSLGTAHWRYFNLCFFPRKSKDGEARTITYNWSTWRVECILIGICDLILMACLYLSPMGCHIYLISALIWIVVPAIFLIVGASLGSLLCMWPWIMNNFAAGYFFVFFLIEGTFGSGYFIENINITVTTTIDPESRTTDDKAFHLHMSDWIVFVALIFLFSRLDIVAHFMKELYVKRIREKIGNNVIESQTV